MSYDDDFGGDRGFKLDGEEEKELDEPLEGDLSPIGDMVFEVEEDDDPDNRYH